MVAYATLGNTEYEKGDTLYYDNEFIHFFISEEEVKAGFIKAGFEITYSKIFESGRGGAILRKP